MFCCINMLCDVMLLCCGVLELSGAERVSLRKTPATSGPGIEAGGNSQYGTSGSGWQRAQHGAPLRIGCSSYWSVAVSKTGRAALSGHGFEHYAERGCRPTTCGAPTAMASKDPKPVTRHCRNAISNRLLTITPLYNPCISMQRASWKLESYRTR